MLRAAVNQTSSVLKPLLMKMTPKMVLIDNQLKLCGHNVFRETKKNILQNSQVILELRNKVGRLEVHHQVLDQLVNSVQTQRNVFSLDDMELIVDETYSIRPFPRIYSHTMAPRRQSRTIERVHIVSHNFEIKKPFGGEGSNFWKIGFRRKGFAAASLEVKLHAKKQKSNDNSFDWIEDMAFVRQQQQETLVELGVVEKRLRELKKAQGEYSLLRYWFFRDAFPVSAMHTLIKAAAYKAKDMPFDSVLDICRKYRKFELDLNEDPYTGRTIRSRQAAETSVIWRISGGHLSRKMIAMKNTSRHFSSALLEQSDVVSAK
ncbi:hypothetical protein BGZ82_009536 [Podila clonocystis]|nr:hypothetical protein BGZ82_009536 [Podila clonocystis]